MKVGLVDSGSSVSLISAELLKAIGDTKRVDPYNNRVLASNNTSVKILGKVVFFSSNETQTTQIFA